MSKNDGRSIIYTVNRHGPIAGTTRTGKTLQLFAENLSQEDVPVLLLDIKGGSSSLPESGVMTNWKVRNGHHFVIQLQLFVQSEIGEKSEEASCNNIYYRFRVVN